MFGVLVGPPDGDFSRQLGCELALLQLEEWMRTARENEKRP